MNRRGFTLIEVLLCISVILIILMLVIPNITEKNLMIKNKGCDAQIEVVNSQILLYEIENGYLPSNVDELIQKNYLTKKQGICPNGKKIYISDGQAYAK